MLYNQPPFSLLPSSPPAPPLPPPCPPSPPPPPTCSSTVLMTMDVAATGYDGSGSWVGVQHCSRCTMTSPTDFCDKGPGLQQDVVHTATPCYTSAGHSGGALVFSGAPHSVRGLLSEGDDVQDEWSPLDVVHLAVLLRTSSPITLWGHTCES
jgi:hypothetical protein